MIENAIARIVIRYLSGALISAGFISHSFGMQLSTDADILSVASMVVGGILAVAAEIAYKLSKRIRGDK